MTARIPHLFPTRALKRAALGIVLSTCIITLPAPAGGQIVDSAADFQGEEAGAYAYVRALEGEATLFPLDSADREELELNLPVLTGDRVWVAPRARVELILSDYNVLRLDGDTEVSLDRLAFSPGTEDTATLIDLREGQLQLVAFEDSLGQEAPTIRTGNAEVFLHEKGRYLVSADRSRWTRVLVREGYAEILTERGSSVLRTGEEAILEGSAYPSARIATAGRLESLERWGEELEVAANYGDTADYVDEELRYAAAPLRDHGEWLRVEGRNAWRPHRSDNWRPYWQGRWTYTPRGMTWVSYEPWGWVPYHYGSWDYSRSFGWVWFPGRKFAPAHVHWYWGRDYVAWFPSGYYQRYYSDRYGRGWGRHRGVYGYAGGSWDSFDAWTFCSTNYLGSRRQSHHLRTGRTLRRTSGWNEVPRGIITTDTQGLTPDRWRHPDKVDEILRRERRGPHLGINERDLPDVTALIAREPKLGAEVVDRVLRGEGEGRQKPVVRSGLDRGRVANSPRVLNSGGETKPRITPPRAATPRTATPRAGGPAVGTGTERDKERLSNQPRVLDSRQKPPRRTLPRRPTDPRVGTDDGERKRETVRGDSPRTTPRVTPRRPVPAPRDPRTREIKQDSDTGRQRGLSRATPPATRQRPPTRSQRVTPQRRPEPRVRQAPPRAPRTRETRTGDERKRESGLNRATPPVTRQRPPARSQRVTPQRQPKRPESRVRQAPQRSPERAKPRAATPPRRQSPPARSSQSRKPQEVRKPRSGSSASPPRTRSQAPRRSSGSTAPRKAPRKVESTSSRQPSRTPSRKAAPAPRRSSSSNQGRTSPPKRRQPPPKKKDGS